MEWEAQTLPPGSRQTCVLLFAGIELQYIDIDSAGFVHRHPALRHILQIQYCRAGQLVWDMGPKGSVFLNPGDFSLHTLDACADSALRFPAGRYQGLTLSIDLQKTSAHPPELLAKTDIFSGLLQEKFGLDHTAAFLAGSEASESIFSAFYDLPPALRLCWQRVKVLELLLYLARTQPMPPARLAEYSPEQIALVRRIHDQLLQHLEQRVTIEELARQYLINPTTLKAAFKAVYGTSIAAHLKEHRLEQAAVLLRQTDRSVAEIAAAVGYESQSKFAAAFKSRFAVLPKAYQKQHQP